MFHLHKKYRGIVLDLALSLTLNPIAIVNIADLHGTKKYVNPLIYILKVQILALTNPSIHFTHSKGVLAQFRYFEK